MNLEETELYMRHIAVARELWRLKEWQEGWNYVVKHKDAFPQEKYEDMTFKFMQKIV